MDRHTKSSKQQDEKIAKKIRERKTQKNCNMKVKKGGKSKKVHHLLTRFLSPVFCLTELADIRLK